MSLVTLFNFVHASAVLGCHSVQHGAESDLAGLSAQLKEILMMEKGPNDIRLLDHASFYSARDGMVIL